MKKFFKQLFCKHKWRIIEARGLTQEEYDKNTGLKKFQCRIGVQIVCTKCMKTHRNATRIMSQVRVNEIEEEWLNKLGGEYERLERKC